MSGQPSGVLSFAYRAPRVHCRLPVEFATSTGTLCAVASNLSDQGLLARFEQPVPCDTTGRCRLRVERCVLELEVRVTHTEGFLAGLAFVFTSEHEQAFVHALVQAVEAAQGSLRDSA